MAFSCLFPSGVNGLHTPRDPPISFTDYIQSPLLNADNSWSSNIPYLLWSANLLEKMRLRDSVSIAMRIELDNHHHWVAQGVSLLVNY